MESSYLVVFSCVAGGLLLVSTLSSLILWARVSAVDEQTRDLVHRIDEKVEPKQLSKAVVLAESSADRMDTAALQLGKFKEQVHNEMQRFYAIMRRNEKAFGKEVQPVEEEKSEYPDEIPAGDLVKTDGHEEEISKAELRRQAREAGMKI